MEWSDAERLARSGYSIYRGSMPDEELARTAHWDDLPVPQRNAMIYVSKWAAEVSAKMVGQSLPLST